MSYCVFVDNIAASHGGAIYAENSSPSFEYCTFINNTATNYGGAIYITDDSDVVIRYCTFSGNSSYYGGGVAVNSAHAILENCTFHANDADFGGGISIAGGAVATINNSIVSGAIDGGGILFGTGTTITLTYSNVYQNTDGNFLGSTPSGLGVISSVNANGDSCDVYGNLYMDPCYVLPINFDFSLLSTSPCIDAGDPVSPYDPDGTIADIGAHYYDQLSSSPIEVALTYNSGSPVPPEGGNINMAVWVENVSSTAQNFEAWIDIEYEGGSPSTMSLRSLSNFLPGWIIDRSSMNFPVAGAWAAGNYMLFGRVGDHPGDVWTESGFPFVKQGGSVDLTFVPYPTDGMPDPFSDIIGDGVTCPSSCTLVAYPNPFNPATCITYQIAATGPVNLSVYNLRGQLVETLVDGVREAGNHEVTFDAVDLASGIYWAVVESQSSRGIQKMILIK